MGGLTYVLDFKLLRYKTETEQSSIKTKVIVEY